MEFIQFPAHSTVTDFGEARDTNPAQLLLPGGIRHSAPSFLSRSALLLAQKPSLLPSLFGRSPPSSARPLLACSLASLPAHSFFARSSLWIPRTARLFTAALARQRSCSPARRDARRSRSPDPLPPLDPPLHRSLRSPLTLHRKPSFDSAPLACSTPPLQALSFFPTRLACFPCSTRRLPEASTCSARKSPRLLRPPLSSRQELDRSVSHVQRASHLLSAPKTFARTPPFIPPLDLSTAAFLLDPASPRQNFLTSLARRPHRGPSFPLPAAAAAVYHLLGFLRLIEVVSL